MVQKGKVSAILHGGKSVAVTPYVGTTVSVPITVPFFLEGALPIGTEVIYITFEDNTGIVLSRMDGGWNERIYRREE